MEKARHLLAGALFAVLLACAPAARGAGPLVLACRPDNDLCQVLAGSGIAVLRQDTPAQAVAVAAEGAGVLVLADGYPAAATPVDAALFETAARKGLRLFVEYPAMLPGTNIGAPRSAGWERTVVASDAFGPALPQRRILMIQDCRFLPLEAASPHLVLARVAGYNEAVFGLPPDHVWPLLFEHPRGGLLVSATKLSQFVRGRYAPSEDWTAVWQMILRWADPAMPVPELKWTPLVRPSFDRAAPLPAGAAQEAVRRGVDWYAKARLLVHPDWQTLFDAAAKYPDRTGPGPAPDLPPGDGSLGLLEAFSSRIDHQGGQSVRWFLRDDCNSESAMAFALRGRLDGDAPSLATASNLMDFVYIRSPLQQGPRADAKSPSYGMVGWDTRPEGQVVYYGDDNARGTLGAIAVAAALGSDRWDDSILRCILANFRLTGPAGFQNARIEEPQLQARGWRWYWDKSDGGWGGYRECPHYQAYGWAVRLWLFDKTQFAPLLRRTERALRHMMNVYPQGWQAESAREEGERCRMLLPLAWLVRVEDTPEHRAWLKQVTDYVIAAQDESGAVRQRVTRSATRNREYGTGECALIHTNGDPCTDLLYGGNFALLGLCEAAAVTKDPAVRRAVDRLADFMVRAQARSEARPELDGAWFRGFDTARWDYWGSNGDVGWGVWSTETGWTQGWIASVLALRQMDTSFWDLTRGSGISNHFDRLRREMLPDDALRAEQQLTSRHAAVGRPVTPSAAPAPQYAGRGAAGLVDGCLAVPMHRMPDWLGYEGRDLEATVDLGAVTSISTVAVHCLHDRALGIYLPAAVEVSASDDGQSFRPVAAVRPAPSQRTDDPFCETVQVDAASRARYVRILVRGLGKIPAAGPAAGAPAWLFVDELMVFPGSDSGAGPAP